MSISRGTRLGPYEIQSVLGAGGMGEVYGAMDTRLGRRVAIKVLPAARAADPERRRRFEQEARAVSALNHPHICTLFDIGSSAPGPGAEPPVEYLVMEWVDGETLAQRIGRGALPVGDVLRYGAQMADALAAAHSAGIVHRDLKPANVMLTKAGVKLLDFGLAKLLPAAAVGPGNLTTMAPAASPVTADGVVLGTVPYMAPEQVEGKEADARSDLFALGAVLYEMATGRRAFEGKSAASVMAAVLERDPPPLSTAAPLAPPALERLVRKCLAKDPSARWQTAADLADELRWISSDDHVSASHGTPGGAGARRRPNLGVAALAVGVLALASVAAVAAWLRPRESPAPQAESVVAPPRVTPFMTSDSVERQPAWSPAGNLIAYVSDKAGNNDIWICDPAGANPINLTANAPGDDAFPAWSPDGQQLAFYSERDGGGIFTMGALGAGVRKVTSVKPSVLYTFGLQWASDSSLVHTNFDADGRKQVYRVPSRGGDPSCLTCGLVGIAGGQSGQLSASGKLLAFTSIQKSGHDPPFTFSTSPLGRSTHSRRSPQHPAGPTEIVSLIFASSREGTPDLWQIPVESVERQTGRERRAHNLRPRLVGVHGERGRAPDHRGPGEVHQQPVGISDATGCGSRPERGPADHNRAIQRCTGKVVARRAGNRLRIEPARRPERLAGVYRGGRTDAPDVRRRPGVPAEVLTRRAVACIRCPRPRRKLRSRDAPRRQRHADPGSFVARAQCHHLLRSVVSRQQNSPGLGKAAEGECRGNLVGRRTQDRPTDRQRTTGLPSCPCWRGPRVPAVVPERTVRDVRGRHRQQLGPVGVGREGWKGDASDKLARQRAIVCVERRLSLGLFPEGRAERVADSGRIFWRRFRPTETVDGTDEPARVPQ